jgi:hypothetical protein
VEAKKLKEKFAHFSARLMENPISGKNDALC